MCVDAGYGQMPEPRFRVGLSHLLACGFSAVAPGNRYSHDSDTRSASQDGIQPDIIPGSVQYNQGRDDRDGPHDAIDH